MRLTLKKLRSLLREEVDGNHSVRDVFSRGLPMEEELELAKKMAHDELIRSHVPSGDYDVEVSSSRRFHPTRPAGPDDSFSLRIVVNSFADDAKPFDEGWVKTSVAANKRVPSAIDSLEHVRQNSFVKLEQRLKAMGFGNLWVDIEPKTLYTSFINQAHGLNLLQNVGKPSTEMSNDPLDLSDLEMIETTTPRQQKNGTRSWWAPDLKVWIVFYSASTGPAELSSTRIIHGGNRRDPYKILDRSSFEEGAAKARKIINLRRKKKAAAPPRPDGHW